MLQQRTVEQQLEELARITAASPPTFSIGSGDVLAVTVFQEPDLSVERAVVRPDGYISLPLLGDVGRQPARARTVRRRHRPLRRYVAEPRSTCGSTK